MKLDVPEQEKKKEYKLVDQKVLSFFIASFKFSQGSTSLQKLFFQWAIQTNHISVSEQRKFCQTRQHHILDQFHIPKQHIEVSQPQIVTAIQNQIDVFSRVKKRPKYDFRREALQILHAIILRDLRYLNQLERPNRRTIPRISKQQRIDSIHDYRASHVRKFVRNPKFVTDPTLHHLFEQLHFLFNEIMAPQAQFDRKSVEYDIQSYIHHIAQRWESLHPGESFFAK